MKIKNIVLSCLISSIIFIFLVTLLLSIDLYCHKKFLNSAGLNLKGYRGKVVGKKSNDEIRIAMIGGSTVLGYGVKYYQALPPRLESELQKYCDSCGHNNKKITVLNLAYNNEGAYAYYYNLNDFFYLDYDFVIDYSGYNDIGIGNKTVYRHSNPIFRIFGYMPILPLLASEKIMIIQSNGHLEDAYWGRKTVFKLGTKDKIKIAALDNFLKAYNNLEKPLNNLRKMRNLDFDVEELKKDKWAWYKHFMRKTIYFCLEKNKKIIIITAPYLADAHRDQQNSLRNMIFQLYKDNKDVLYLNLGEAISLENEELCSDGVHLTPKGCQVMAEIIAKNIGDYICGKN